MQIKFSATLALLFSLLLFAPSAQAARADGSDFACRGSAVHAVVKEVLPLNLEPLVANPAGAPCKAERKQILAPTTIGPVRVDLASAETRMVPADLASASAVDGDLASASASVTNPAVGLSGLNITAAVLTSQASYTCQGGVPVGQGSSVVTNLTVNGTPITIPSGNAPFTLNLGPLGMLYLNQTVRGANSITQRALHLTTPLADVTIAESIAAYSGNPCAPTAQCADARDNDGDGKIDATDPGCLSGPGKSYNPLDNDESNPPSGKAKLTTVPASIAQAGINGSCVRRSFSVRVTGRSIKHVSFFLDGKKVRVDKKGPFAHRMGSSKAGIHRVSARVKFLRGSGSKARTLSFRFKRCAPPVRFTG